MGTAVGRSKKNQDRDLCWRRDKRGEESESVPSGHAVPSSWARGTAPEEDARELARRPGGGPFLQAKGPCAE